MASSSDSSSSDDNENLREALDPNMFVSSKYSVDSQLKNSARQKSIDVNHKNNILNVTPEFQNFVAKRLTEMLDKTIKEYQSDIDFTTSKNSGGIRLFAESKGIIKDRTFMDPFYLSAEAEASSGKPAKKKKKNYAGTKNYSETESEILSKAKSAAVSPSWVLEKKGTIGWSKPKGEAFLYRENGSKLEIVDHRP